MNSAGNGPRLSVAFSSGSVSFDKEGVTHARKALEGRSFPREELSQVLYDYNKSLDNDATALKNTLRLAEPSSACIITGQQLGFMGGPAYTFLKIISCILLARQAGAIPVFWAATEDHDSAEINHTYLVDPHGNLVRYQLSWPTKGAAVEDLQILPQHPEVFHAFWQALAPYSGSLELPKRGMRYADVMLRLLTKVFAGTGLVLLEPKLLQRWKTPIFEKEIKQCDLLAATLRDTTSRFVAAGGQPSLQITNGPNLFFKDSTGTRVKIHHEGNEFLLGRQTMTTDQLLELVKLQPELFSSSAALRPVVQSVCLPTLAYVAGPTERNYHHQLGDYFQAHGTVMPWIVPRISATFVTPIARRILDALSLNPWDLLPITWNELMPEVDERGAQLASGALEEIEIHFGDTVSHGTAERATEEFVHRIKERAIQGRLSQMDVPHHALHFLHNFLHPQEKPQERVLSWWSFQACSGSNLVRELLATLDWRNTRHHYIDIKP